MRHVSFDIIGAVSVLLLIAACASIGCGSELRPPSDRDPVSPKAPQAAFDAGPNPLGATLSAATAPADGMSGMPGMSGMSGMPGMSMPMPSASSAPAPSGPRR
jgi:hypothetical protein